MTAFAPTSTTTPTTDGVGGTRFVAGPHPDDAARVVRRLHTEATHDPELHRWSAELDPAPPVETLLGVVPERAGAPC